MRRLFAVGVVLAIACGKPDPKCVENAECGEGQKCVQGICIAACTEAGCLDGRYCDADTERCIDDCPYTCDIPDNSTAECSPECEYRCNPNHFDDGAGGCPACDTVDHCGTSCEPCPVPTGGEAFCAEGECGITCSTSEGYRKQDGTCEPCDETDACGPGCLDCTLGGTRTGYFCDGGTTCKQGDQFSRDTSSPNQPIVMDKTHNLIWQGCTAGFSGDDCKSGVQAQLSWWDATGDDQANDPDGLDYCPDLHWGGINSGWHLPTRAQIKSMMLASCPLNGLVCVDTTLFPETPMDSFWTSETYPDLDNNYARTVNIYDKSEGFLVKYYLYNTTRCVHGM
jgi:hypothetical protein